MTPEERDQLTEWRTEVDRRTECQPTRGIARGTGGSPRTVSASAWRCEGRWQVESQMDIWDCLAETEPDPADE